ncbi:hypothetical protein [Planktosalinus lacus]|uniref:Uncharacterized protein n=1 Tax=Planktosalinus lacus TaxID=1526573 RepID=A0A8J2V838_9FLAO|nr:hypothetical protein [Planktosalinus lacus]GGD86428.1 hypothetical protein GCM10011312_08090 [Planktosalinus lacus]
MKNDRNFNLDQILSNLRDSIDEFQPKLKFPDELKSSIERLVKSLKVFEENKIEINIDYDAFKAIGERLNEYTQNVSVHTLLVSRHGWFIDLIAPIDMPANAYTLFKSGNIKAGDKVIGDYYHEYIDDVFDTLKKRHKRRKFILEDILNGYKEKNYRMIIPCIFTQIDGISNDFTKKAFFTKKEKKYNHLPEFSALIKAETEGFLDYYISPLQNQTPIMVNEKYLGGFPCKFNRHQIIHGSSVSYGNKTNSLKAISFLKYLSDILTSLKTKGKIA